MRRSLSLFLLLALVVAFFGIPNATQAAEPEGCYCSTDNGSVPRQLFPEFSTRQPDPISIAHIAECAEKSGRRHTVREGAGDPIEVTLLNCTWKDENSAPEIVPGADKPNEFVLPANISTLNRFPNTGAQGVERAQVVAGRVIKFLIGIIGSFALIIFITAGVLWMTAGGNSDRERRARDMMFWAVLGIVTILGSFAVVDFIIQNTFVQ